MTAATVRGFVIIQKFAASTVSHQAVLKSVTLGAIEHLFGIYGGAARLYAVTVPDGLKSPAHKWGDFLRRCAMDSPRRILVISLIIIIAWVFICPWVIKDVSTAPASWSFWISGAFSLILVFAALVRPDDLPEYGLIAVSAWLVISPWILGYSEMVTRQSVLYGVVIGGLAYIGRPSYKPRSAST